MIRPRDPAPSSFLKYTPRSNNRKQARSICVRLSRAGLLDQHAPPRELTDDARDVAAVVDAEVVVADELHVSELLKSRLVAGQNQIDGLARMMVSSGPRVSSCRPSL